MPKRTSIAQDFVIDRLTNSIQNVQSGDSHYDRSSLKTNRQVLLKFTNMGLIKEPLDVDFVVDPRPLTKEEEQAISAFIKADKVKRAQKKKRAVSDDKTVSKSKQPA